MGSFVIAIPYAKAAFMHAEQQGDFDKWSEWLHVLGCATKTKELSLWLKNPNIDNAARVAGLLSLVDASKAPHFGRFLHLLARQNRLSILYDCAQYFQTPQVSIFRGHPSCNFSKLVPRGKLWPLFHFASF